MGATNTGKMIGWMVVAPPVVALEKANAPESIGTSACACMVVVIQSKPVIASKTLLIMQILFNRNSRKSESSEIVAACQRCADI
jgi:hypothetical protein